MRNHISVNNVAITISVTFSCMLAMPHFFLTLDHVGEHMSMPTLDDITKVWISLFFHSLKARLAWRTLTGYQKNRSAFILTHQMVK